MENVLVKDLYRNTQKYSGKEIKVSGWVRTVRDSKTFGFIELNDGSFFKNVQVVFDNNLSNFDDICKLSISSSIIVSGTLVVTENAKQPFEIKATNIDVFDVADSDYPLQKKRHTFEYLRTISYLRPRTNTFNAVLEFVVFFHMLYTSFFKKEALYMFIHHLLLLVTVKVLEKCLQFQL